MAKEILAVPEEHLQEVIDIIRMGLDNSLNVTPDVAYNLKKWCDGEEDYLNDLSDE